MDPPARHVIDAIAADIRNRSLAPGDMLPSERELGIRFGVGRSVIRSAICDLGAMGLLDLSPGRRPRVATPNLARTIAAAGESLTFILGGAEGRAHLEQVRLFLESSLIRYAVQHANSAHVARMVEAIDDCEARTHDRTAYLEADVRFHRVLAEIPGNPVIVALHEAFVARLMAGRELPVDIDRHLKQGNDEHKQIVTAIMDRDVDRALAVLTRHLERNFSEKFRLSLTPAGPVPGPAFVSDAPNTSTLGGNQ